MMENVYYVKAWYYDLDDKLQTEEAFLIANNYCNVADKIEKTYGNCLVGYRAFAFDANMIYVADIEEYLNEARGIFNEG